MEKATFGAGCFWGVEETFRQLKGVAATAVGYEGGTTNCPTYKDVCTDRTGHAEVVQVEYDPKQISYEQLLDVFWHSHNPTSLNRQGPDVGTQYRSVIFFHDAKQEKVAKTSKEKLQKTGYKSPIVTQIVSATIFWKAEDYHQQYLAKRGLGSCHI
jgi:peptide-methionine (S)-S-oxide reductase